MASAALVAAWDYNATAISLSVFGLAVTIAGTVVAVWTLRRVGRVRHAQLLALARAGEKRSFDIVEETAAQLADARRSLGTLGRPRRPTAQQRAIQADNLKRIEENLGRLRVALMPPQAATDRKVGAATVAPSTVSTIDRIMVQLEEKAASAPLQNLITSIDSARTLASSLARGFEVESTDREADRELALRVYLDKIGRVANDLVETHRATELLEVEL